MKNEYIKIKSETSVTGFVAPEINWVTISSINVKEEFKSRYSKIIKDFQDLLTEVEWHTFVSYSQINFTPTVNQIYYVYERTNETRFISLIAPHEWGYKSDEFLGATKINYLGKWEKEKYENKL